MKRKTFIKLGLGGLAMTSLQPLYNWSQTLKNQSTKMPVLFIGHGSPMNGIEDNEFSRTWAKFGKEIPRPEAVLVISAHWLTSGTHVTAMENPKTIHDFGGFPQALFEVQYPAKGNPILAKETASIIAKKSPLAIRGTKAIMNHSRDHTVAQGLEYVATWNAAMLLSEDLFNILNAANKEGK